MNSREERKRKRLEAIKSMIGKGISDRNELMNIMIVNFAVTRRTALEEIDAVKFFEGNDGDEEVRDVRD